MGLISWGGRWRHGTMNLPSGHTFDLVDLERKLKDEITVVLDY